MFPHTDIQLNQHPEFRIVAFPFCAAHSVLLWPEDCVFVCLCPWTIFCVICQFVSMPGAHCFNYWSFNFGKYKSFVVILQDFPLYSAHFCLDFRITFPFPKENLLKFWVRFRATGRSIRNLISFWHQLFQLTNMIYLSIYLTVLYLFHNVLLCSM